MRLYMYGSVLAWCGAYDGFVLTLKLNSEDLPPFENSESASGRLHILEGGGADHTFQWNDLQCKGEF